jgi:SAM-dependent MidA family methyltransferase
MTFDFSKAFKSHALADPLENPGESDLTADCDFSFLKRLATNMGGISILKKN